MAEMPVAMPHGTASSKNKRPRQKFDEAIEAKCEKESANCFRPNSHFSANGLAREKKDSRENQPEPEVDAIVEARRCDENPEALPR